MNEISFLQALRNSLETIEVKGKSNLDVLLGCIMAIDSRIADLGSAEVRMEESTDA